MSARPDAGSQIEYLAWFRFPVTWNYISGPALESASVVAHKPLPAAPSLTLAPIVPASLSRGSVALDVVGTEDGAHAAGSAARWEMMVPKMARPPARPVTTLSVPATATPALPAPAAKAAPIIPPPTPASAKTAAVSLPVQFATPSFSLHTPEDQLV